MKKNIIVTLGLIFTLLGIGLSFQASAENPGAPTQIQVESDETNICTNEAEDLFGRNKKKGPKAPKQDCSDQACSDGSNQRWCQCQKTGNTYKCGCKDASTPGASDPSTTTSSQSTTGY